MNTKEKFVALFGLMSIITLSAYAIIFPINSNYGKILGLSGVMIYFVFTISHIIVLPSLDKNKKPVYLEKLSKQTGGNK